MKQESESDYGRMEGGSSEHGGHQGERAEPPRRARDHWLLEGNVRGKSKGTGGNTMGDKVKIWESKATDGLDGQNMHVCIYVIVSET